MTGELGHAVEAVQFAIKMEIDGKEYYLKISRQSRNEAGKQLLATLAAAEDVHRQKFESLFEAIRAKQAWPKAILPPPAGGITTIFAVALAKIKPGAKGTATEIDAVDKAIGMEIQSYEYYKSQSMRAARSAEKDFYEAVAAEEHTHHLTLLDYREYLADPAAWFVKAERPSFDAGA